MAPGDLGGAKLNWPDVKKLCSQADIERLACLAVAYLNNPDASKLYTEAANQFGGKIKPDSYKRGLWVISKKIKDAQGQGGGKGGSDATPSKGAKKSGGGDGRKRARDDADEDDEEAVMPKSAKKQAACGKRSQKTNVDDDFAHSPVKGEQDGDGLDGIF